jgi:hypothetical protein
MGPEHPDTLTSMGNLALVLKGQGKQQRALPSMKPRTNARQSEDQPPTLPTTVTLLQ